MLCSVTLSRWSVGDDDNKKSGCDYDVVFYKVILTEILKLDSTEASTDSWAFWHFNTILPDSLL